MWLPFKRTLQNLADRIYYVPVTSVSVKNIISKENPDSIMVNFEVKQLLIVPLNCIVKNTFEKNNIRVLGTNIESVIISEDREQFAQLMDTLGEPVSKRFTVNNIQQIDEAIEKLGFPMIMRNGFALGGLGLVLFIISRSWKIKSLEQLREML